MLANTKWRRYLEEKALNYLQVIFRQVAGRTPVKTTKITYAKIRTHDIKAQNETTSTVKTKHQHFERVTLSVFVLSMPLCIFKQ
jgi:hypothetical protein